MAMIRWRPLGEVDSFRRQMDRMFDRVFSEFGLPSSLGIQPRREDANLLDNDFIIMWYS